MTLISQRTSKTTWIYIKGFTDKPHLPMQFPCPRTVITSDKAKFKNPNERNRKRTLERKRNYEVNKTTSFAKFGEEWDGDIHEVNLKKRKKRKKLAPEKTRKLYRKEKAIIIYYTAQLWIILKSPKNTNTKCNLIKIMT